MPRQPQVDPIFLPPQPIFQEYAEEQKDTCVICQGDIDAMPVHMLQECRHEFHSDCLIQWFRTGNVSCPTCRGHAQAEAQRPNGGRIHNRTLFSLVTRFARKKTSPKPIQDLYKRWQMADKKHKEANKQYKTFCKEQKPLLTIWRKLRRQVSTKSWIAHRHKRHLLHIPIAPARV